MNPTRTEEQYTTAVLQIGSDLSLSHLINSTILQLLKLLPPLEAVLNVASGKVVLQTKKNNETKSSKKGRKKRQDKR